MIDSETVMGLCRSRFGASAKLLAVWSDLICSTSSAMLGLADSPAGGDLPDRPSRSWLRTFDFLSLTPIERIELADTLYDSAMQEIEAAAPALTAEQLAELDRRIAAVQSGQVDLLPWEQLHASLMQER